VLESDFPASPTGNVFGYGQSKWAAEWLAREAQARGARVVIYRPGAILGAAEQGFWSPKDVATRFTAHALASETVSGTGGILEGIPVDVAASFIAACSQDPATHGQTYHLIHPRPISVDEWAEVLERHGMPARYVSNDEWTQQFMRRANGERPLSQLRGSGVNMTIMECLRELPTFDAGNFHRQLSAYGIACPDYEALVERGWLDALRPK
jgi:thioester reductase-like protein